jgi:transposase
MSTTPLASWVGIDVAKDTFDAGVAWPALALGFDPSVLRNIPTHTFARTKEGVKEFLDWARTIASERGTQLRVVMEATGGYSIGLAAWITEEAPELLPAIANAKRTSDFIKSLGVRNKTDRLEARALALYGLQRQPSPYQPLTPARAQLRSLVRYRDALVQERVAERQRTEEGAASATVRKLQKRRIAQLDRDIQTVEKEMAVTIGREPQLKRDLKLLTSIYGVAFITAAVILAEIGDLRAFKRARQLTAFAGVSPKLLHSGTSRRSSRLCKEGNGRIRKALYMAATTAIRGDNQLAWYYRKLREAGKPHKAALAAIMRKMLTIMRAILIAEKDYDPHQKAGGKLCGKPA